MRTTKKLIILMGFALAFFGGGAHPSDSGTKAAGTETAIFSGGCFWCVEHDFDQVDGVISTTSGFEGGHTENPTYDEVSRGGTGYAESVQVVFDPKKVGYERLLSVFWMNIDPTTPNRQFCDSGSQYRSAIFYMGETQKELAEKSKRELEKSKPFSEPIVTEIVEAGRFYPAEEYHQDYYKKNPVRYNLYRLGCGRDRRLEEVWGKAHHE